MQLTGLAWWTKLEIWAIEVNAVMHCNLTCAERSHGSSLAKPLPTDPAVVFDDLSDPKAFADVREVRIVGSEPVLHPRLCELLRVVRTAWLGQRVRLITNGTRLRHAGWKWVNYVYEISASIYPDTAVPHEALDELRLRGASTGAKITINPFNFFQPVVVGQLLSAEEAAAFEACQLTHAWSCSLSAACRSTSSDKTYGSTTALRPSSQP